MDTTLFDMEKIKKLRIRIDAIAQLTGSLITDLPTETDKRLFGEEFEGFLTDEIKRATHSLYKGKAWLGKLLGELGAETPYKKDGKRKSVEDIEETSDTAKETENFPLDNKEWKDRIQKVSSVEKVDWLRQEIKAVIEEIINLDKDVLIVIKSREGYIARTNAYTHLCEARFELGFELERIRKEKKQWLEH